MKISEKQLQMLMVILQDAQVNIVGDTFCFDLKTRNQLLNDIINQQDETLKEIEDVDDEVENLRKFKKIVFAGVEHTDEDVVSISIPIEDWETGIVKKIRRKI